MPANRAKTGILILSLGLGALHAAPALPQVGPIEPSPPPACVERQPNDVVSAWSQPAVAGQSGHNIDEARNHPLVLGKPNKVSLVTLESTHFPAAPGGAEQPKQYIYAGVIGFHVPKDGTYRVVTDEGMRIDVAVDGKLVDSSAFGRGPRCSGKFVDFPLHEGDAALELYGAPYETVTVLILPRP
jgi:hypothetical protein